jgi:hypothetical protein
MSASRVTHRRFRGSAADGGEGDPSARTYAAQLVGLNLRNSPAIGRVASNGQEALNTRATEAKSRLP